MLSDVVIIGAGLMGTAAARELSKYDLNITVIEKGYDVCSGSSKATSAIVHSGYHEKPGSLKAKLGVEGNALLPGVCKELDVPFKQTGSLLLALNEEDKEILELTKAKGEKNGVKGLRIVGRDELKTMEPALSSEVIEALYAPDCGVVSPMELAVAMMENACENGVKLITEAPAVRIEKSDDKWIVITPKETIHAKYVINTAGIHADEVSSMAGDDSFKVTPFKGEEYILDRNVGKLVSHVIEAASLDIIAMPTSHENLMIGTTRVEADKDDFKTTREGFKNILSDVQKVVTGISPKDIITSFAGLRAINNTTEDFIIEHSKKADNWINVSIGSPGVFATPAIANMVVNILENSGLVLKKKESYNPYRKAIVEFKALSEQEKEELIKKDKRYGHIVCRCETITEGQIVEAIRRGARTLDGVKCRTRAGMGRCQGGFCTPRVLKIMAREIGISVTEITKKGGSSVIVPYKAKDLLKEKR